MSGMSQFAVVRSVITDDGISFVPCEFASKNPLADSVARRSTTAR